MTSTCPGTRRVLSSPWCNYPVDGKVLPDVTEAEIRETMFIPPEVVVDQALNDQFAIPLSDSERVEYDKIMHVINSMSREDQEDASLALCMIFLRDCPATDVIFNTQDLLPPQQILRVLSPRLYRNVKRILKWD